MKKRTHWVEETLRFWMYTLFATAGLSLLIALCLGLIGTIQGSRATGKLVDCDPTVASCSTDIWVVENLHWCLIGGALLGAIVWILVGWSDEAAWRRLSWRSVVHLVLVWAVHVGAVLLLSFGARYVWWSDSTCIGTYRHQRCGLLDPDFSYTEGWSTWSVKFVLITDFCLALLLAHILLVRAAMVHPDPETDSEAEPDVAPEPGGGSTRV